jgi:DNA ligase-1
VKAFAALLERLVFTPARTTKLALLRDWIATQPDPDRGIGLAAITGELSFSTAKAGLIRALAAERTDPVLFAWSYDYVGDLAETVSLIWPARAGVNAAPPSLAAVAEALATAAKADLPGLVAGWLDALDASSRVALLKLITGGLRVGVSARLAKVALAEHFARPVDEIEEAWPAVDPPYLPLFRWLEGAGPQPRAADAPVLRPLMLANPLEEGELAVLDPASYRAEWKWDGIRVQLVATRLGQRIWSRGGEDITRAFPEVAGAMEGLHAVLDGELLVIRNGVVAPFSDLQQRLNRKSVGPKLLRDYPCAVRLYDILFEGEEDLRGLPFDARRARLEAWIDRFRPERMDLSALVPFASWDELSRLRDGAREAAIEGLMLKRADSPYLAGRPKGPWFKWKRDPLTIDAVLMYAQRGHGKRSSFYSDYTFGLWRADGELVPVGKAYFGFTDQELAWLDRWIRNNTVNRFGPVREVEKALVLEIAFDAAQLSTRHKSGVALRFPRISRIRSDKPAAEADALDTLLRLVENRPDRPSGSAVAVREGAWPRRST